MKSILDIINVTSAIISLLIFVSITAAIPSTQPQQLHDRSISKRVLTKIGYSLEMSCVSLPNRTFKYCRWDRSSGENQIISLSFNSTTKISSAPGYTVNHTTLSKGDCSIRIECVKISDITLWKCVAIDGQNQIHYFGDVEVVLRTKPTPPLISDKNNFLNLVYEENGTGNTNTFNVTCCAEDGVPPADLKILFEDKTSIVTPKNQIGSNDCLCWPFVKFNWMDNNRHLTCQAKHAEYLETDIREDSVNLNIFYSPKILVDNAIAANGSKIAIISKQSQTQIINISFTANPMGSAVWTFGSNVNYIELESKVLKLSKWRWASVLTLDSKKMKQNTNFNYWLHVRNKYGLQVLEVEIIRGSGNQIRPTWTWLFFIIIGAIVCMILSLLTLFLSRRNGWLCFENRTGRYNTKTDRPTFEVPTSQNRLNGYREGTAKWISEISLELTENPTNTGTCVDTNNLVALQQIEYDWRYPGDSIQAGPEAHNESKQAKIPAAPGDSDENSQIS